MLEKYRNKRILLIGGMGFIGSSLARQLVTQEAQVGIIDNFLPDHGANWFNIQDIRDRVMINISDIRDELALKELVKNQDYIFVIAAQTSHSDSMRDPFLDTDINCRGNLILLEACRQYNPDARIVYTGTRAYYGSPQNLPVNETATIAPQDIYAVNRFAGEQYMLLYHYHYGLKTTSLRIGNIYGPRAQMKHPKYNVLNWFVRLALENRPITIFGDGEQIRDYIFVDDACQAMLLAGLNDRTSGEVYNVGAGSGEPFVKLARTIVELAGQGQIQMKPWPEEARKLDVGDFIMDIGKIKNQLGWYPQTAIRDGLKQTVEFYRKYGNQYW